jgi:hypothetical protein
MGGRERRKGETDRERERDPSEILQLTLANEFHLFFLWN